MPEIFSTSLPPPWLLEHEIENLCEGLTQSAAQIRYIKRLGLTVRTKPNGRPLVMRADFAAIQMLHDKTASPGNGPKRAPNREAFIAHISRAA